jgi:hypothetical protein
MRFLISAVLLAVSAPTLSTLVAAPAQAWGPVGHRITGAIADRNLSGVARANVRQLLGGEDLAEVSTWPDDMRSDPAPFWQKLSPPWHYVTVLHGDQYQPSDAPPEGDAVTALNAFTAVLRNPNAPREDRRTALIFIVHIIGDLHQPLHVGARPDRGGNDVKLSFFGQQTNLHAVWDSGMIGERHLSYSEYADWLERAITPEQVIAWSGHDPLPWMAESLALEKGIYPADTNLSWTYLYQHAPEVDLRLKQGGIRIASYLNWVFETPPDGPKKKP